MHGGAMFQVSAAAGECELSIGDLKFSVAHLPLEANNPIVVHAFRFEPGFQSFAGFGTELGKHFSFDHVDEDAFGASWAAALHALGEGFRALASEAGEGVLREVARHWNSWKRAGVQVFHKSDFHRKRGTLSHWERRDSIEEIAGSEAEETAGGKKADRGW
jgi:hypothetical protein